MNINNYIANKPTTNGKKLQGYNSVNSINVSKNESFFNSKTFNTHLDFNNTKNSLDLYKNVKKQGDLNKLEKYLKKDDEGINNKLDKLFKNKNMVAKKVLNDDKENINPNVEINDKNNNKNFKSKFFNNKVNSISVSVKNKKLQNKERVLERKESKLIFDKVNTFEIKNNDIEKHYKANNSTIVINDDNDNDIEIDLDQIVESIVNYKVNNENGIKSNKTNNMLMNTDTKHKIEFSALKKFIEAPESPQEFLSKRSKKTIITDKKDKSYYKFLKDLLKFKQEEVDTEICFSDFSFSMDKLEHKLKNKNKNKLISLTKYSNDKSENNTNIKKNLIFNTTLEEEITEIAESIPHRTSITHCFSALDLLKTEQTHSTSNIDLHNEYNTTANNSTMSKKKVTFSENNIIHSYDNKRCKYTSLDLSTSFSKKTPTRKKSKNQKLKSIMKKNNSVSSTFDLEKSIALEKLNELIKECEIAETNTIKKIKKQENTDKKSIVKIKNVPNFIPIPKKPIKSTTIKSSQFQNRNTYLQNLISKININDSLNVLEKDVNKILECSSSRSDLYN